MKVSVIIPTYKPNDYLWKCLDSIARQSFRKDDFEVILVLNGCNEPWKERINAYIEEKLFNVNAILIQTNTPGVSNARNIGIERAIGEFITFIDDDDYISEQYLEELYKNAGKTTVSVSNTLAFSDSNEPYTYHITNTFIRNKDRKKIGINKAKAYFSGPWMKLCHKSIIGNHRFDTKLSNGEDTLFMFEISDKINNVVFTSEKAIYYRRFRENSATTRFRSKNEKRRSDYIQLKALMNSYFKHPFKYNFFFFCSRILSCIRFIVKPV